MYSGTTFRVKSGRVMGVHQRIDRIARRKLAPLLSDGQFFPRISDILHFEGKNGPDGIKSKSPGRDEPWHFIDPYHEGDHMFFDTLADHVANLAAALSSRNDERAAFEAAWLAHAVTDGLTPAHHYPLEEKLQELRGEGMHTRSSKKQKVLMPGVTRRHQLQNNWEFWGAKGVMTTHVAFEFGVATAISGRRFDDIKLPQELLDQLASDGYEVVFRRLLRDVAALDMYSEFEARGWSRRLARQTNEVLIPHIVQAVALGWLAALQGARQ